MKKPNRSKQKKALIKGRKKREKQLEKNKKNKIRRQKRKASIIAERKMKRETFKMEDEVRRIQNKGLTYRKPKEVTEE